MLRYIVCLLLARRLAIPAGLVRTALPDMDRELRDRYLLVVQAKDMVGQMGGLSGTTSVTVMLTDVNDNPPRFPRSESDLRRIMAQRAGFQR